MRIPRLPPKVKFQHDVDIIWPEKLEMGKPATVTVTIKANNYEEMLANITRWAGPSKRENSSPLIEN